MSTKHVRNTGDLVRFDCALKIECSFCNSARTLSAMAAVKGLGLVDFRSASKRFRCLRCGKKEAKVVVLPQFYQAIIKGETLLLGVARQDWLRRSLGVFPALCATGLAPTPPRSLASA